jgi:hypothetical protein
MKKLSLLILVLSFASCAPIASCPTGELLGTDNQCYSCTYGTPEYAGNEFGYCGSLSAGGVACCSSTFYNWGSVSCYPSQPWLCSDALCHSSDIGACVYVP